MIIVKCVLKVFMGIYGDFIFNSILLKIWFFFFYYEVVMVFSGVGDVLGFKSGFWKFYKVGNDIFEELKLMGGLFVLNVKCNIILI